jgi:hypothetical protein
VRLRGLQRYNDGRLADAGKQAREVAEEPGELRARRLTLVDDAGRVRATLGPAADGSTALRLYDTDDRARVELAIEPSGVTLLTLRDGDGEFRTSLVVGPEGATRLHLHGAPAVSLHDNDGEPRAVLGLDEHTGMATLSCVDAEGNCCLLLAEDPSGGRLHLFQRDGTGRRIPACDPGDPDAAGSDVAMPVSTRPAKREGLAATRPTLRRRLSTALLVFLATLAGVASGRFAPPPAVPSVPASTPPPSRGSVLEGEELVLSDRAGTPRMRLSVLSDGTPLLLMTDSTGRNAVELGVPSDTGAILRLKGIESSIALVAPPHDTPTVSAALRDDVLFQAPSNVARLLPADIWP